MCYTEACESDTKYFKPQLEPTGGGWAGGAEGSDSRTLTSREGESLGIVRVR